MGSAVEKRVEDAVREANLAMVLRPNEATVLYNAACTFCNIGRNSDAIDALRKAWDAGFRDADRRLGSIVYSCILPTKYTDTNAMFGRWEIVLLRE